MTFEELQKLYLESQEQLKAKDLEMEQLNNKMSDLSDMVKTKESDNARLKEVNNYLWTKQPMAMIDHKEDKKPEERKTKSWDEFLEEL